MDIKLEVTDAALSELALAGFDPVYGARPLRPAIQSQLNNPLAKEIPEGHFGPKDTIVVDYVDGKFQLFQAGAGASQGRLAAERFCPDDCFEAARD